EERTHRPRNVARRLCLRPCPPVRFTARTPLAVVVCARSTTIPLTLRVRLPRRRTAEHRHAPRALPARRPLFGARATAARASAHASHDGVGARARDDARAARGAGAQPP